MEVPLGIQMGVYISGHFFPAQTPERCAYPTPAVPSCVCFCSAIVFSSHGRALSTGRHLGHPVFVAIRHPRTYINRIHT